MENIFQYIHDTLLIAAVIHFSDLLAAHSFVPFIFKIGIPVYKKTIALDVDNIAIKPPKTIKKDEGKFRFTKDGKVYFLSQLFFFKFLRFHTPFPFRAIGKIESGNKVKIVGRISLITSLLFLSWILIWTLSTLAFGIKSWSFAIPFGVFGVVFAGAIFFISYYTEKKRMEIMVLELKNILEDQVV